MASIAFDGPEEASPPKPPISTHPAFPAIVALWFAALLGLGSLILPGVLLERLVVTSGIAAVVPDAHPPLGFTARGLVAGVGAVAGALLGLVVARRVARAHSEPAPRFARASGFGRRPIRVHEELGGESLVNGRGLPVTRRRALAIAEDERPSDFLYTAPVPGEGELEVDSELSVTAATSDEPLELCEPIDDAPAPPAPPNDFAAAEHPSFAPEDDDMSDRQEFRPFSPVEEANDAPEFTPPAAPEPVAAEAAAAPPLAFSAPSLARRMAAAPAEPEEESDLPSPEPDGDEPDFGPPAAAEAGEGDSEERQGLVQLVQRLGASLERRRAWLAESAAAPAPLQSVPAGFEAAPAEEAAQAMAAYFGRAETAPQASVPVAFSGEPEPEAAPGPEVEPEAAAEPEDLARSPLSFASAAAEAATPPSLLQNLASLQDDEDEDDDAEDALPVFTLPLRRSAAASPAPVEEDPADFGAEEPDAEEDGGYSSLLAMRNPFTDRSPEFVRIEDSEPDGEAIEPAVVFPGREAAHSESADSDASGGRLFDPPGQSAGREAAPPPPAGDTDAALRAALATLQRMSGAA